MRRSLKKKLRIPESMAVHEPPMAVHEPPIPVNIVPPWLHPHQSLIRLENQTDSAHDGNYTVIGVTSGIHTREQADFDAARGVERVQLDLIVSASLYNRGYKKVYLVIAKQEEWAHIVVHALAFIPHGVLREVNAEILDHIPMHSHVDVTATDCGHEDCHQYPELGLACYESTHPGT